MDVFECKLLAYANEYRVQPEKYAGKTHRRWGDRCDATGDDHPYIRRNPDKCILCGLCTRVCDEAVGAAAIGLAGRGFDSVVQPAMDKDLRDTGCVACGMCAAMCPTGALTETQMLAKQVPLQEEYTETVCPHCEIACKIRLAKKGGLVLRALPSGKSGLLCQKGRFGFGENARLLEVPEEAEARFLEKIARANDINRG